jgi:hypothetical protein
MRRQPGRRRRGWVAAGSRSRPGRRSASGSTSTRPVVGSTRSTTAGSRRGFFSAAAPAPARCGRTTTAWRSCQPRRRGRWNELERVGAVRAEYRNRRQAGVAAANAGQESAAQNAAAFPNSGMVDARLARAYARYSSRVLKSGSLGQSPKIRIWWRRDREETTVGCSWRRRRSQERHAVRRAVMRLPTGWQAHEDAGWVSVLRCWG